MHTGTTADNPYRLDRYAFAWHYTPAGSEAHLDFGCHGGEFLRHLDSKGVGHRVGIDAARYPIETARQQYPDIEFKHARQTVPLPFPDKAFRSITALDVIEHLVEQRELLDELSRVLRDDGVLIVTVPASHIFSFLDAGNWKFRCPRLHRWWYLRTHSVAAYEARYVSNPDGLIGDISAAKRWHEHFSRSRLRALLESAGFVVEDMDGAGFFCRLLLVVRSTIARIGTLRRLMDSVMQVDARWFESAHLFCVAKKRHRG